MAKAWLRDVAARLLLAAGVTTPRRTGRGRLSIATFHRVLPEALRRRHPLAGLAVTPEELARFLDFFARHFEVGPLAELAGRWHDGDARPLLALTFDDAQRDNWEHARPVLERHGVSATFFAPAGAVAEEEVLWHDRLAWAAQRALGRGGGSARHVLEAFDAGDLEGEGADAAIRALVDRAKDVAPPDRERAIALAEELAGESAIPDWEGTMDFASLRDLLAGGHEIGSHSWSHALLPQLDDAALRREVEDSRARLEAELDAPVTAFCYPNGDSDARVQAAVRAAGYRWAVTTRWGANAPGADPLALARYEMHAEHALSRDGSFSEPRVAWRMTRFYPGVPR